MKRSAAQRKLRLAAILLLIGGAVALWVALRPIHHPPGLLISSQPALQAISPPAPPFKGRDNFEITRLATYRIRGRVLGIKRYHDAKAKLSPYDILIGWGVMSDSAVLSGLEITQRSRYYSIVSENKADPPISNEQIEANSANLHLIPGSDAVSSLLSRIKPGELVELQGALVKASKDVTVWSSPLRQSAAAPGGCEILYVEQASFYNLKKARAEIDALRRTAEASRGDLMQWYNALAKWREAVDWNDPAAVREFNTEAALYQAASKKTP